MINEVIVAIGSGFKSSPKIENGSSKENKKIEPVLNDQLIYITFHNPHYEWP
jgi:hypothetical protein